MVNQLKRAKTIKREWTKSIIKWEENNGRDFAWRSNRTPYKILIAEVLLKRTTATAAIRVYNEFIQKYSNISMLNRARYEDLESILRPIGLYKQRANQLIQIAEYVVNQLDYELPPDYNMLIDIPGVGDYTASAILTFSYNTPKAVIDSNVERVLKRVFGVKGKELRQLAEKLVPLESSDVYNYGMIDLGALICHYRYPKCPKCPLRNLCLYKKN